MPLIAPYFPVAVFNLAIARRKTAFSFLAQPLQDTYLYATIST